MKLKSRPLVLVMITVLVLVLSACGQTASSGEWTREGSFQDEDGNYLIITNVSEYREEYGYATDWAVTWMPEDGDMIGNCVEVEGNTLHGNIMTEGEEGEYVVTISEEDEDGVLLVTADGKEYHLGVLETPDVVATLSVNTEGLGHVSYAEGDTPEDIDEEYPAQSCVVNLTEAGTYTLNAKPEEDWVFVKWTKDGEDFSEDEVITVEVSESVEYVAVFDLAE